MGIARQPLCYRVSWVEGTAVTVSLNKMQVCRARGKLAPSGPRTISWPNPRGEEPPILTRRLVKAWLPSALPALGCVLVACESPTDRSDEVFVTIHAPAPVLVQGAAMTLTAHAWRRLADGDSTELQGASIGWPPPEGQIATVRVVQPGVAVVTGIERGSVGIRAIPLDYESGTPGEVTLRVVNTVEIDSVRPSQVRYGEQLEVFGTGLGQLVQVSLAGTPLIVDSTSFRGDPTGVGQIRFWVPYPARTGVLSAVAAQGTATSAPESTAVLGYDVYDDIGDDPADIDLNGPAVFPDTLFRNPALVFESEETVDAYRFSTADSAHPVSFIVSTATPVVFGFEPVFQPGPTVRDTFPGSDFENAPEWSLGVSGQHCHGRFIAFPRPFARSAPVSIVRAFRRMPAGVMMLGIYGEPTGRYGVAVVDHYVTADPAIGPDRIEDDDTCNQADTNATDPERRIDLPLQDTLTIDNPYDVDWLRITVPGPDTTLLTVLIAARPFGASDSSDIGLVVLPVDLPFFGEWPLESHAPGSSESLTIQAPPGDYYVAVVDDAGVATRYGICIGLGSTCTLPTGSLRLARARAHTTY